MKTSLFNSLLVASLLVFAVGCGKEKSKSGNPAGYFNPYINPAMPVSGQTALTNLRNWYSTADTQNLGFRGTYIKKTESVGNFNFNFQGSFCFFGLGSGCNQTPPTPTHCFIKNANQVNYDVGTATGALLTQCTITQHDVTKATNVELTAAVNGPGLQLIDVQQQGNVYYLVYSSNGYTPEKIYTIDTNLHSVLNPVQVQTISGGNVSQTIVKELRTYQF